MFGIPLSVNFSGITDALTGFIRRDSVLLLGNYHSSEIAGEVQNKKNTSAGRRDRHSGSTRTVEWQILRSNQQASRLGLPECQKTDQCRIFGTEKIKVKFRNISQRFFFLFLRRVTALRPPLLDRRHRSIRLCFDSRDLDHLTHTHTHRDVEFIRLGRASET